MDEYLLQFKNIDKKFPGVHALQDVSLDIKKGEVHALLGANGAGKSTLIKILARVYHQTSGDIVLKGKNINHVTPETIRQYGIDFIFQELELVPSFSVAQNVLLGSEKTTGPFLNWRELTRAAQDTLDQLIPGFVDASALVRDLSVAQQQMVCIARSLYRKPKILVLDEPTSRLSASEVDPLFSVINKLKHERGITAIYISHRLEEIFRIADRFSVLRDGELITTKELSDCNPKEIIRLMMGQEIDTSKKINNLDPDYSSNPALEIKGLSNEGEFGPINFSAYRGEVFCITGAVGSKKTEILETIYGLRKPTSGEMFINGKKRTFKNSRIAKKRGFALVPEDRRKNGVIYDFSVKRNVSLASLKYLSRFRFIIKKVAEKKTARKLVSDLKVKTASVETPARTLSGGNQQKVVLAKWVVRESDIYFFDEPTVGIDVMGKEEIYDLISKLARQGKAVVVSTSEIEEALRISTRIMVVFSGKVKGQLKAAETNKSELLYLVMGGQDHAGN
jgi:ABC-type sugar transport system ATPase subunit